MNKSKPHESKRYYWSVSMKTTEKSFQPAEDFGVEADTLQDAVREIGENFPSAVLLEVKRRGAIDFRSEVHSGGPAPSYE